ncbi:MAG TPA: nitrate reductase molybdenum cofactor assembly chaperone [bacterium]|nr:nitrate reductase molybdenum cofactor assembly chaperone [bacterium]
MSRQGRPEDSTRSRLYKLLSVWFQYPSAEIVEARAELAEAARALPDSPARRALEPFLAYWTGAPAPTLPQHYVATFDLEKRSTLYLSYYLYGDRRQRGMAFVRLRQLYAAAGLEPDARELPDYLPLVLEFAAVAPPEAGTIVLTEYRPSLELLHRALADTGSPYAGLTTALRLMLPPLDQRTCKLVDRIAAEGPPTELVGLELCAPPAVMRSSAARVPTPEGPAAHCAHGPAALGGDEQEDLWEPAP